MSGSKKITNNKQFETMVSYLEENTDLVTGHFNTKSTKRTMEEGWHEMTIRLNAEGPPVRDDEAWKKVWADLKNKIKKKLREIHKDIKGTGGGSKSVFLTPFEERVVILTGLTESAVGVPGRSIGHIDPNDDMSTGEVNAEIVNAGIVDAETVETIVEGTATATVAPRSQRRRTTQFSKMYDELKEQGRKRENFNTSVIALLKEANETNNKRLKVEEARLQLELNQFNEMKKK